MLRKEHEGTPKRSSAKPMMYHDAAAHGLMGSEGDGLLQHAVRMRTALGGMQLRPDLGLSRRPHHHVVWQRDILSSWVTTAGRLLRLQPRLLLARRGLPLQPRPACDFAGHQGASYTVAPHRDRAPGSLRYQALRVGCCTRRCWCRNAAGAAERKKLHSGACFPFFETRQWQAKGAGVCFDHTRGLCTRGDACKFSHDPLAVEAFNRARAAGPPPPRGATHHLPPP